MIGNTLQAVLIDAPLDRLIEYERKFYKEIQRHVEHDAGDPNLRSSIDKLLKSLENVRRNPSEIT